MSEGCEEIVKEVAAVVYPPVEKVMPSRQQHASRMQLLSVRWQSYRRVLWVTSFNTQELNQQLDREFLRWSFLCCLKLSLHVINENSLNLWLKRHVFKVFKSHYPTTRQPCLLHVSVCVLLSLLILQSLNVCHLSHAVPLIVPPLLWLAVIGHFSPLVSSPHCSQQQQLWHVLLSCCQLSLTLSACCFTVSF